MNQCCVDQIGSSDRHRADDCSRGTLAVPNYLQDGMVKGNPVPVKLIIPKDYQLIGHILEE